MSFCLFAAAIEEGREIEYRTGIESLPNMRSRLVVCFAFLVLTAAALAAPQVQLFTREDALARLSAVLSTARVASGAECVACENALGEVIHQAIGAHP